jgi:short-subunit dehydrogenase
MWGGLTVIVMGERALITGATSGIGYELAKCVARDRYDLVLVARSEEELQHVADELRRAHGISVTIMPRDLARPDAVSELVAELARAGLHVDVLVNNAGFGTYGPFAETALATAQEMMQLNMVTLTQLTRRLLPGMLEQRAGKILNVASTAAFQPGPLMAVYYATKAYTLSFSEALASELRGSGVTVTVLCPGLTRTGFQQRAGLERTRFMRGRPMEAEVVARIGYRALMRGTPVVVPGLGNRLLTLAVRFVPRRMVTAIARGLNENRSGASHVTTQDRGQQ